jgi:hypothetical protein
LSATTFGIRHDPFAAKRLRDIHPDGPAKRHADVVERGVDER